MNSILPASALKMEDGKEFVTKGSKVLIECKEDSDTFENSRILKAESYKKYARVGWIRQFGDTLNPEDYEFSIGDQVYFNAYTGIDLDIDDKHYKLIDPNELLCKVE